MVRPIRLTNSLYLTNRNVVKAEPRRRTRQVPKANSLRQISLDTSSTLNSSVHRENRNEGREEGEGEGGRGREGGREGGEEGMDTERECGRRRQ